MKTRHKVWFIVFIFTLFDLLAFFSVPTEIRRANWWTIVPGGGYVLAVEYHFGNKLQETSHAPD